jgi:hypothetical protein
MAVKLNDHLVPISSKRATANPASNERARHSHGHFFKHLMGGEAPEDPTTDDGVTDDDTGDDGGEPDSDEVEENSLRKHIS